MGKRQKIQNCQQIDESSKIEKTSLLYRPILLLHPSNRADRHLGLLPQDPSFSSGEYSEKQTRHYGRQPSYWFHGALRNGGFHVAATLFSGPGRFFP